MEEQVDSAPSGSGASPRQTSPARSSTQTLPGSRRSAPIVIDDGKQLFICKNKNDVKHQTLTELILTCFMLTDELFGRLGPSPSAGTSDRQTTVPESSAGGNAKGKQIAEDASPSGTLLPKESDIQRAEVASSWTSVGETSRRESAEVPQDPPERTFPPKDPLEDFSDPPAGTPYDEGSYTPSGSYVGRDLV